MDDGAPKANPEGLDLLKNAAETGKPKPVIDRVCPLEEIVAAHLHVDGGHKKGNVIVTI